MYPVRCCAAYKEEAQGGWKDHLAYHLEQFALLAIGEDEEGPSAKEEVDKIKDTEEYALDMGARHAAKTAERALLATNEPVTAFQDSPAARRKQRSAPCQRRHQ